jgi:GT2 family glycosyltransferase
MMISREAINKVGLLDETYFMFYEEYDYCHRIKKAGFDIFYNGKSYILHKQSVAIGKNSALKSYYMFRNRIYFSRKNFTGIARRFGALHFYYCHAQKLYERVSKRTKREQCRHTSRIQLNLNH